MPASTEPPAARLLPWALRALWVCVLLVGGRAIDGALADAGDTAADVARWTALGWWIIGVAAMAVPAVVSLTATRVMVPTAVPIAITAWINGAGHVDGALFAGAAVLATVVAGSSTLGRSFVRASAYGDEDRHLLRPPLPYLLVALVAWIVWATIVVVTAISIAAANTVLAVVCTVVAVAGGVLGFPRWHRLSRRWLVLVPAGLVVHDPIVLAETLMLRRREVAALGLAPADTDAADLTGPASGHAIEIRTVEPVTVLLAMSGQAIHLTGCLVAPTRPGQVLAAASTRRLPLGLA